MPREKNPFNTGDILIPKAAFSEKECAAQGLTPGKNYQVTKTAYFSEDNPAVVIMNDHSAARALSTDWFDRVRPAQKR